MARIWIGEPGRHLALDHGIADRLGPGPRLVVGEELHQRDLASAMTGLAMLLEDGQDVLGESRRGRQSRHAQEEDSASEPGTQRTYPGRLWSKNAKFHRRRVL